MGGGRGDRGVRSGLVGDLVSGSQVVVVVRRPGHPERRLTFGSGIAHMGRAEDNDVVLTDIGVSRRHARLLVQNSTVFMEDLGSGNGTYFEGNRVNRQEVHHGDEFFIDPFRISIELVAFDSPTPEGLTGDLEEVDDDDTAEIPADPMGVQSPKVGPETQVRLVTLQGQRLAPSYPVRSTGLTIGRSEARDVILFDPAASRNHAAIELFGGDIWFRDQGSGNGSFVNGHRVREQCLRNGDRVRVGSTEFRLEVIAARQEVPTMPPTPALRRRSDEGIPSIPVPAGPTQIEPNVQPNQGPKLVALAAAGGFAIVLMMVIGAVLTMYVLDRSGRFANADSATAVDPVAQLSLEDAAQLKTYIADGNTLFERGDYLGAAGKFYAALRISPTHPEAERMGSVSCEYVMLDSINKGVLLRGLSDEVKQQRRSEAVRVGRRALRGKASVEEAREALMDVLVFAPEDEDVGSLLEQLKSK